MSLHFYSIFYPRILAKYSILHNTLCGVGIKSIFYIGGNWVTKNWLTKVISDHASVGRPETAPRSDSQTCTSQTTSCFSSLYGLGYNSLSLPRSPKICQNKWPSPYSNKAANSAQAIWLTHAVIWLDSLSWPHYFLRSYRRVNPVCAALIYMVFVTPNKAHRVLVALSAS